MSPLEWPPRSFRARAAMPLVVTAVLFACRDSKNPDPSRSAKPRAAGASARAMLTADGDAGSMHPVDPSASA